ncbi:hypothetical protein CEXT_426651 [Caerostris extrusa]|uniref:Uncharacterized protein n=1 Tax=Caerostris extrusa TaxID=172846 RepID=A0AAV4NMY1_CAEEX|nr:hypothetical protein CEXT_426651 [Caerostris extrusa]
MRQHHLPARTPQQLHSRHLAQLFDIASYVEVIKDSPAGHMEESVDDSGPPISDNSITTTSRHVETDAVWDVSLDETFAPLAACALGDGESRVEAIPNTGSRLKGNFLLESNLQELGFLN